MPEITKEEVFAEWSRETPLFARDMQRYLNIEERLFDMVSVDEIPDGYKYAERTGADFYSWGSMKAQVLRERLPGAVALQAVVWDRINSNIVDEQDWAFTHPYSGLMVYTTPEVKPMAKRMVDYTYEYGGPAIPYHGFLQAIAESRVPNPNHATDAAMTGLLPEVFPEDPERAHAMARGAFMLCTLRIHAGALSLPGPWPIIAGQYKMYMQAPGRKEYEQFRAQGFEAISGEAVAIMASNVIAPMIEHEQAKEQ